MFQRIYLCSVVCLATLGFAASTQAVEKPLATAIVPRPVSCQSTQGKPFAFDADSLTIQTRDTSPDSLRQAARTIEEAVGFKPKQQAPENTASAKVITLAIDPAIGKGMPDWQAAEAYTLNLASDGNSLTIAASNAHGLFDGVQTLVQLIEKTKDGQFSVPAVQITDYPRFPWRGYLLDTARHFRSKAETKRYLDLMARYKLNVFHWHLVDDQGWRIEIKRYPKLTEVGSKQPDFSGTIADGRFFTQADIKEIIAYAADRHIRITPEIEMPGHSTAATVSYPEIACGGKPAAELCAGNDKTFEFMTNVLDEVAELFPSPYIHIGADEVQPERWRACPLCKKKMDELAKSGLPEGVKAFRVTVTNGAGRPFHEDIGRLQGDFVRRIDKHLATKGKRMIGWDEILDGGLANDSRAIVAAWRSPHATIGAAAQGRDVVTSIYPVCYLDNGVSLADTYAFEPVPAEVPAPQAAHVLGVEGNMWNELTPTQQRVDQMTFPRLCALAEVGWTQRDSRDFNDFTARLRGHSEAMKKYGITLFP